MKHLLVLLIGVLTTLPAFASTSLAMTEKDMLVIARIVGLLQNHPAGETELVVVANNESSLADANSLLSHIARKGQIYNIKLNAGIVTPEELEDSTADVVVIPEGFDMAQMDAIFEVALRKKLVTISTSDVCLAAKRCAIFFKSEPAVDIRMSQSVSAATNVRFSPTLRMMIKEVP